MNTIEHIEQNMSAKTDNGYIPLDAYTNRRPSPECKVGGQRVRGVHHGTITPDKPLVSIVTVVYNREQHLAQTIESVLNQTYTNIEHIIIDGGSTDGTIDIIEQYNDRLAFWLHEADLGISDAFNKGVALAEGEFIGILNADDWMSPDQVEQGVRALQRTPCDFVFGDMLIHDTNGAPKYRIRGNPAYAKVIESKMPELNHPTVLARRSAYERIGGFNIAYKYAMDYDWMLRLHRSGGRGIYIREIVGHMREAGVSDRLFVNALNEVRLISAHEDRAPLVAEILFGFRVLKGMVRRILERWAPGFLYRMFRKLINPRFSGRT